ncbi:hypothetical protein F5B20DRAFT_593982 [Whalleya microplaca]|nr:hypothetical protein F5B20DRAFT_593982 [Whalleya microplaca]
MDNTKPDGPMATSRTPLANRSNINLNRPSSPGWDHKDSSEGPPSSHSSVYDAAWVSTSDVAKSPYQTAARPATPPPRPIDLNAESPLAQLETPTFRYGHGTELATILEQRSIATMRTASLSTSDISSLLHASYGGASTSSNAATTPHRLRRQHSFSLDDLPPRRERSEPLLLGPSHRHDPPPVQTVDIHAYPQKPTYPAHQGSATPPGCAGWATGQDGNPARAGQGLMNFDIPFRGLRSGHGNLSAHPYMRRQGAGSLGGSRPRPSMEAQGALPPWDSRARRNRNRLSAGWTGSGESGHSSMLDWAPHGALDWTCRACNRPADQWWSLQATITGHGEGSRRGESWCTRCAWRKLVYLWCCCEYLGL